MEVELGGGDGRQVGGEGEFAGQVGTDLVAVGLKTGDLALPEVARAGAGGRSRCRVTALGGNATKTGPVRSSVVVITGPPSTRTACPSARPG